MLKSGAEEYKIPGNPIRNLSNTFSPARQPHIKSVDLYPKYQDL